MRYDLKKLVEDRSITKNIKKNHNKEAKKLHMLLVKHV